MACRTEEPGHADPGPAGAPFLAVPVRLPAGASAFPPGRKPRPGKTGQACGKKGLAYRLPRHRVHDLRNPRQPRTPPPGYGISAQALPA
jgi:hypothetical protein